MGSPMTFKKNDRPSAPAPKPEVLKQQLAILREIKAPADAIRIAEKASDAVTSKTKYY